MFKSKDGIWHDDFRQGDLPRWHVQYGKVKKPEAVLLSAVALSLVRSKDAETIDRIRSGELTIEQVARLKQEGKPLTVNPVTAWPSVKVAVTEYLDWMENNPRKQEGTRLAASTQLNRFLGFLGADIDLPLDAIPTRRVTEYQAWLGKSGAKPNTVTGYVWRVGSLYRWHRDTEKRDADEAKREPKTLHVPIDPHSVSTERTRRTRYLTSDEGARLLAACPDRMLCPVAIGLLAGLRVDEVCHLRTQYDVDLDLGLLTVQEQPGWRPKTGKRRDVPIAPPLRPLVEMHVERFASEDWLVPSLRNPALPFSRDTFDEHFKMIVGNAELVTGRTDPNGVVFHTLRHTFASWLVMAGVDLYTVAQLLGNSLRMVEVTYSHLSPDFRQRAMDRLSGAVLIPEIRQGFATTESI
jgi:integrase